MLARLFKRCGLGGNQMRRLSIVPTTIQMPPSVPGTDRIKTVFIGNSVVPLPPKTMAPLPSPENIVAWGKNAVLYPPDTYPYKAGFSKSVDAYLLARDSLASVFRGLWVCCHYEEGIRICRSEYEATEASKQFKVPGECMIECLGCEIQELIKIRVGDPTRAPKGAFPDDIVQLRFLDGNGVFEPKSSQIRAFATFEFSNEAENKKAEVATPVIVDCGATHCLARIDSKHGWMAGGRTNLVYDINYGRYSQMCAIAVVHYAGIKVLSKCVLGDYTKYDDSLLGMSVLSHLHWSFRNDRDPAFTIDGISASHKDDDWTNVEKIAAIEKSILLSES